MVKKTLQNIDSILSRINTHPEFSILLRAEIIKQMWDEATRHSIGIETQAESDGTNKTKRKNGNGEAYQNLTEAIKHLSTYGISTSVLSSLGHKIEPEGQPENTFRQVEVQFGGFAPPSPRVLMQDVDNLVRRLETFQHPVERAIEAHLDMVRIHPYTDGNGRAARLLQNFCLQQSGYPPAIIPSTDRDIYISLIAGALSDRYTLKSSYDKPSEKEDLFRMFIAAKVLASTERLENELKSKRRYSIMLSGVDGKGLAITLCDNLRGYGKKDPHRGITSGIEKMRGGYVINVTGNVSSDELDSIMGPLSKRYHIKYKLKTLV
ncbi:Fic family protein [Candidatus Woesearchaeota archaeon]|nr:Fic family protein [Candidatus Woesearchaeota archaeon]